MAFLGTISSKCLLVTRTAYSGSPGLMSTIFTVVMDGPYAKTVTTANTAATMDLIFIWFVVCDLLTRP